MRSRRSVFPDRKEGGSLPLAFDAEPSQPLRPARSSEPLNEAPGPAVTPATEASLWLGLQLPALVIESHVETGERHDAVAVIDEREGQLRVVAGSARAVRTGVVAGMPLGAALALCPALTLVEFDARLVNERLTSLARDATRYTSEVSIETPDQLLLDVGASLRLFDGAPALMQAVSSDFAAQGHEVRLAAATTPKAALWLAKGQPGTLAASPAELKAALRDLPLGLSGWPAQVRRRLESIGVGTFGECRRLPRTGFARRFGKSRLLDLDRAYGDAPDPRTPWQAPVRFSAEFELDAEIEDTGQLADAAAVLFGRLSRFLRRRQAAVRLLTLRFYPLKGPAASLTLRSARAGQDVRRWQQLLGLKLDRLVLDAPAVLVGLSTPPVEPLSPESLSLALVPGDGKAGGSGKLDTLLERLTARLGHAAVARLAVVADQRPECAMRWLSAGPPAAHVSTAVSPWHELERIPAGTLGDQPAGRLLLQRPLWLLREPSSLGSTPRLPRGLGIVSGPERIETGWWDGHDIARDYYVALATSGTALWVFRDRRCGQRDWYLQGFFG